MLKSMLLTVLCSRKTSAMKTHSAKHFAILAFLLLSALANAQTHYLPKGVTIDPVCGAQVSWWSSYYLLYKGVYFDFDSRRCRDAFKQQPLVYLVKQHGPGREQKDPVCGAKVDLSLSYDLKHAGQVYHFHSLGCRESFRLSPARYLAPEQLATAP
jgi:YHS domain-containing protein